MTAVQEGRNEIMKTYGGNEVQFHTFFTSTTDDDVNNVVSYTLSLYTVVYSLRKASYGPKHVACIFVSNKHVFDGYLYPFSLRWFPSFQVATTCLSCSPPDLNSLVTFFFPIFVYM